MKKLVAVLCAAVMTFGMAVNVFAEPSPSTSGVVTKIESATDANGKTVDVKLETLSDAEKNQHFTEEEKKAVAEIKESKEKFEAIAKKVLGEQFKEGMALVDIRNLYIPEGAEVTFPLTITAKVTGVTKDSTVAVLHFTNGKCKCNSRRRNHHLHRKFPFSICIYRRCQHSEKCRKHHFAGNR